MNPKILAGLGLCLACLLPLRAAIIGTNVPALPVTAERIATLPVAQQPAWQQYLEHSIRQRQADKDFLRAELVAQHLKQPLLPHGTHNADGLALDKPSDYYASVDARRIADTVISFQTPAGGWGKNTDYTRTPRVPGEMFSSDNASPYLGTNDFDQPHEITWSYVGTFDNDATSTELRFLALVIAADTNAAETASWRTAFGRGLNYIFAAQFPNGGWPQVWPLQGGYHDTITINDDAMIHVVAFLYEVAAGTNEFSFVPADWRAQAQTAEQRGLDCLLAAQIVANGHLTVWCQQHDALTLQPASARNFEMPAAVSSESAEIVLFLMRLPNPDARQVAAVHAAVAWFEKNQITGKAYNGTGKDGKKLVDAPGHDPIWARYYEIGTDRPIFGDRDKTIHDNVNEISRERRNGYGWYRDTPKRVLEHYKRWAELHPAA